MTRHHRQPLEAALSELAGLDMWLAADLGVQHPSAGAIRGTLHDVRSALQRAVDHPHGDAADAEVASRQLRTLMALRAMLADLDPKPAELIDFEDRLGWVCDQLVRAGGRADPR
jgi:hypothetical protein